MDAVRSSRDHEDRPLVLIIDDDSAFVQQLSHTLQSAGFRITYAEDGETGLAIAEKYVPNVILLDLGIPGRGGVEICREIKSRLDLTDVPVIFLTEKQRDEALVAACFDAGGHDCLTRPISSAALLGRLRVAVRDQEIREAYRRLAVEDPLTGLANRRQLVMHVTEAVMASRRERSESVLILGDIDGLMGVNSRWGHDLGDEAILTFSRLMKRLAGPHCRAGRLGGDELAMTMVHTTRRAALTTCHRLRRTFSAIAFDATTHPKHFTASFGLACFNGDREEYDVDQFLTEADSALYAAKLLGRDRVVAYWELDPSSIPEIAPQKRHTRTRKRRRTERAFVGAPPAAQPPIDVARPS